MITHLVDSDWTIDYLNGRSTAIERLNTLMAQATLATSIIVVGEVQEGAVGNAVALTELATLLESMEIYGVDRTLATIYAELRSSLRKSGS